MANQGDYQFSNYYPLHGSTPYGLSESPWGISYAPPNQSLGSPPSSGNAYAVHAPPSGDIFGTPGGNGYPSFTPAYNFFDYAPNWGTSIMTHDPTRGAKPPQPSGQPPAPSPMDYYGGGTSAYRLTSDAGYSTAIRDLTEHGLGGMSLGPGVGGAPGPGMGGSGMMGGPGQVSKNSILDFGQVIGPGAGPPPPPQAPPKPLTWADKVKQAPRETILPKGKPKVPIGGVGSRSKETGSVWSGGMSSGSVGTIASGGPSLIPPQSYITTNRFGTVSPMVNSGAAPQPLGGSGNHLGGSNGWGNMGVVTGGQSVVSARKPPPTMESGLPPPLHHQHQHPPPTAYYQPHHNNVAAAGDSGFVSQLQHNGTSSVKSSSPGGDMGGPTTVTKNGGGQSPKSAGGGESGAKASATGGDGSSAFLTKLKLETNPAELNLNTRGARYFVIKSYSEDDVHRSIKYSIWCSTDHGNKRLDAAWRERETKGPIYLFFSVNASGHFCGIAQMMSAIDYNRHSGVWAQDKWKGLFHVKWLYVKDVPNGQLRHIRLENNENKPVTNSRDTQEVPTEKGRQVLRLIHQYKHTTSLFDDFGHYEKRQLEEGAQS